MRYVSKNRAPRPGDRTASSPEHCAGRSSPTCSAARAFVDTAPDVFDTLIVDEAHRLNEKSGLYGNQGDHQVSEIIRLRACGDLLHRRRPARHLEGHRSTRQILRSWARRAGAEVTHLQLDSQFRCNGSDGYLAWLDDALGIRATANRVLEPRRVRLPRLRLAAAGSGRNRVAQRARPIAPEWLRDTAGTGRARRTPDGMDVVIPEHGFGCSGTLPSDEGLWITAPESVVRLDAFTPVKGLRSTDIGVIIGPDLIVRGGEV